MLRGFFLGVHDYLIDCLYVFVSQVPCPKFLRMDYRDIPNRKYNKITCLEMAEHVGVKNFSSFLAQVLVQHLYLYRVDRCCTYVLRNWYCNCTVLIVAFFR